MFLVMQWKKRKWIFHFNSNFHKKINGHKFPSGIRKEISKELLNEEEQYYIKKSLQFGGEILSRDLNNKSKIARCRRNTKSVTWNRKNKKVRYSEQIFWKKMKNHAKSNPCGSNLSQRSPRPNTCCHLLRVTSQRANERTWPASFAIPKITGGTSINIIGWQKRTERKWWDGDENCQETEQEYFC